jgi:hypothetical protein
MGGTCPRALCRARRRRRRPVHTSTGLAFNILDPDLEWLLAVYFSVVWPSEHPTAASWRRWRVEGRGRRTGFERTWPVPVVSAPFGQYAALPPGSCVRAAAGRTGLHVHRGYDEHDREQGQA